MQSQCSSNSNKFVNVSIENITINEAGINYIAFAYILIKCTVVISIKHRKMPKSMPKFASAKCNWDWELLFAKNQLLFWDLKKRLLLSNFDEKSCGRKT